MPLIFFTYPIGDGQSFLMLRVWTMECACNGNSA